MKLIKYIFTLLVGATALSLTSCNDFLDRDPLGQFTEDDSPNALVGGKIFNVYYLMRSYDITAGIPAFMVHMVRSEDSEKGSDAGDGSNEAAMWDDFEYTASNGPLSAYWGQNYKIIYQCNEILDDIEKSGHKDDTEAIRNRGEALFFRAWCYFNLVRAFGEVPLVTIKVVEASDANVPKTTAEKIYEQIDKDLTEAEECLPLRWDSDYTGRLTWGAARSLHARTYMMRNDWDNMYTASTEVIKSGIYNLNTPVDKVFTVEGENCGESIFELQCEATDAMKEDASIGSQFCQVQGVRGAGEWDLGWGWHMATKLMGEAFEPGDPAPERHIALLPPQHGRAHHTGEYQPALWRVTRIHRHGCLLQQEGLHGPDTAPQVQPYGFLGKHPPHPLSGRAADGCRSRQRERADGRSRRVSGTSTRPCPRHTGRRASEGRICQPVCAA